MTSSRNTLFYGDNLAISRDYPRLQILTIADLFNEAEVIMPPASITFKQAQKVKDGRGDRQAGLLGMGKESHETDQRASD